MVLIRLPSADQAPNLEQIRRYRPGAVGGDSGGRSKQERKRESAEEAEGIEGWRIASGGILERP